MTAIFLAGVLKMDVHSLVEGDDLPSGSKQMEIIQYLMDHVNHRLCKYAAVIDGVWIRQWAAFCENQSKDNEDDRVPMLDPLIICTPASVKEPIGYPVLKDGLDKDSDYFLVPMDVWDQLNDWYGAVDHVRVIPRPYVRTEDGQWEADLNLPVLRYTVVGSKSFVEGFVYEGAFPRQFTVGKLKSLLAEYVEEQVENLQFVVADGRALSDQLLIADVDGMVVKIVIEAPEVRVVQFGSKSGRVGLMNLGNTCFMNSALQCLSNCEPLCRYLLEARHVSEINRENPIGTGGVLLESFWRLLMQMWDEELLDGKMSVDPHRFKSTLGRFEPRFLGYQQHDSQELASTVLDRIHEDLNRVLKKPYIELNDGAGRPDVQVAREAWEAHCARNNSIVVDTFHGQFRSQVTCPECEHCSVTFDPFLFVSVPLPMDQHVDVSIVLIRFDAALRGGAECLEFKMTRRGATVRHLLHHVSVQSGISLDQLQMVHVGEDKELRILQSVYPISHLSRFEGDGCLLVYEMPPLANLSWIWLSVNVESSKVGFVEEEEEVRIVDDFEEENGGLDTWDRDCCRRRLARPFVLAGVTNEADVLEMVNPVIDGHLVVMSVPQGRFSWQHDAIPQYEVVIKDAVVDVKNRQVDLENCKFALELFASLDLVSESVISIHGMAVTLDDCMRLFSKEEVLGQDELWYCARCKDHRPARKAMSLFRLPSVLVVHLKRFQFTHRSFGEKIGTPVDFAIEDEWDVSEHLFDRSHSDGSKYRLFAISEHYGSLGMGHYTATCRNWLDQQWYHFDDSSVQKVSLENLKDAKSSAYMLFYQRVE